MNYTIRELSALLGVGERQVANYVRVGRVKADGNAKKDVSGRAALTYKIICPALSAKVKAHA